MHYHSLVIFVQIGIFFLTFNGNEILQIPNYTTFSQKVKEVAR